MSYLREIIYNYYTKAPDVNIKLSNFFLLSKIYEALEEGKIGGLDRVIDTALFIGGKADLGDSELSFIYQLTSLKDIGKIIIRHFSKIQSKAFEEEFNESITEELLNHFFMKRDNEDLYHEIVNAAVKFVNLTKKNEEDLNINIEKLNIDDSLKSILKKRLKEFESEKCFNIKHCPEILRENCPSSISNKNCFETENISCYHNNSGKCKSCLVFKIRN